MDKKIKAEGQIKKLVERFEENISQYKRADYDEANTRADFIDPFFENLGWDVTNKQGYAEQYREVVREAKVIIAGKHKAPDYSFRIGGMRKFFVEAKRPSIALKSEISPAYQLRRYAYTAKLPLSILTDFEEFSVYDTRIKPTSKDSASCARVFYCGYKDYLKNFDFIYDTFSKEGILRGSFDRYIESTKNKRGTSEVDKEFLKLIDKWRENLAKNIALRNKSLSLYELNFAVQKIVDRIIFLRITEDRQIEDYGKLQILLNGTNTYRRLMEIFLHSDKKYNSGLFDFERDEITPGLSVDDKVIKEILKSVYYPESPYEFSVLDVEILGNIYEQFLGKTIRLTPAHQVKVEEKPEVKRAGGVYYTPKYIVDYIVKNTVGEIIKGKTPKQIDKIKILDPACGSGSFLLGAYQYLLNHHLNWYSKDENYKKALKKGQIIQTGKDSFQLTIAEKQRILLNNIFGVDIDNQAVEVSKLSLLLKLLEGETEESTRQLFRYTQMKLLPNLSNNIKCGNSLIGPDFYDAQQATLFDEAEMRRINVFDWKSAFPDIFHNGGFDVVIGNPPYITYSLGRGRVKHASEEMKYIAKHYPRSSEYKINSFAVFYEKALQLSRPSSGLCAFIVPGTILINKALSKIRFYLLSQAMILRVVLLNYKVFAGAEMGDCTILLVQNRQSKKYKIDLHQYNSERWIEDSSFDKVNSDVVLGFPEYRLYLKSFAYDVLKIGTGEKFKSLGDKEIAKFYNGIKTGNNKKFLSDKNFSPKHVSVIRGRDFDRYVTPKPKIFVYFDPEKLWSNCNAAKLGTKNKIIIRQTGDRILATIEPNGVFCMDTVHMIYETSLNRKFLLGLLNSRFLNYYHYCLVPELGKAFAEIKIANLKKLPVPSIEFSNPTEKAQHDKLVSMVERMLELQKEFHSVRLESDKKMYKTQIDVLDNQIDSLVYKLYGLSEEEIKVIEKP